MMGVELYVRAHPDWRSDREAAVRQALENNETWVAEVDGKVAGFVNVISDLEGRSGEIDMIAVDPGMQRRGAGSSLTGRALDVMLARGIDLAIVATGAIPATPPRGRRTTKQASLQSRGSGTRS